MSQTPTSATHLVDVIHHWAKLRPEQEVLRFYPQGEGDSVSLSFAALHQRCQAIASQLQAYQGQHALLLYNNGLEFLEALFACFYAGVVAVPAYPPRRNHHLQRLSALITDCQASVVLSASDVSERAQPLFAEADDTHLLSLPWLDTDKVDALAANDYQAHTIDSDDLAFIQYTSGSTGTPKGVMLSHKNLMCNIRMAERAFGLPSNARCVSWLPLFHDMGLIGSVMAPLYWGAGSILMPPAAFLQKPLRWLKLLDKYGKISPVGCTAPNFSYQLCVDNVSDEQAAELDLSQWIFALSGAEPIRASTLNAFIEKFAASGFSKAALVPAYGMAECTVLSTCRQNKPISSLRVDSHVLADNRLVENKDGNLELTSSGSSCDPQKLRIVHPQTLSTLADKQVGEIWLAGDHIGQGYWQQPALSKQTFNAYTAEGDGPFLRTGDLGSLIDGELFVTGRIKDLLIIRGNNHYPQDIELTVMQAAEGVQAEHTAAFTIEHDEQEKLVIVQEVQRQHQRQWPTNEKAREIRNAIAREHGIECHAIAFIRFASIPKTSSGKIQRHACKAAFLQDTLNVIGLWQADSRTAKVLPKHPNVPMAEIAADDLEQWVVAWLAQKTGLTADQIPVDAPLDGLGLDSVDLVQLSGELEAWLAKPMPHTLVWEQDHIRGLADALMTLAKETHAQPALDNEEVQGCI